MRLLELIFLHWCKLFSLENSFLWHPDEPYLQKLEIGTQMSLPVEVKPVWWCITSQLQTLVWEGHTFINGTMIDATWSTILSANTPQVGETTVIFHRWDIVLEKQLPPGLWGNLQVSFGLWFWFLWCVPEPPWSRWRCKMWSFSFPVIQFLMKIPLVADKQLCTLPPLLLCDTTVELFVLVTTANIERNCWDRR